MARRRMVTRTITFTTAEVMCLNVVTAEVEIKEFKISGIFEGEKDLTKALKKTYETDNYKLVKVNGWNTEDVLFGMDETKFMELAEVLPPRTVGIVDEQ